MHNFIQNITDFIFRFYVSFYSSVIAQGALPSFEIINPISIDGNLEDILTAIRTFLLTIGIPIAIIMYLWAGFQFLTSGGQPEKIKKANQTLIWTTVGIGVLILASGIQFVIMDILTG